MLNKFLTSLLTVVMLLECMPAVGFAETQPKAVYADSQDEEIIEPIKEYIPEDEEIIEYKPAEEEGGIQLMASIFSPEYFETNKADVWAWSTYGSDSTYKNSEHIHTYKTKGTVLKMVSSKNNKSGNMWYKDSDGRWVWSGNLKKHSHKANSPSTKKWYEHYNNTKHEYHTETAAKVCTGKSCDKVYEKKSSTKQKQKHEWVNAGKCKQCGYKFKLNYDDYWFDKEYMALKNITLRKEPYSDADAMSIKYNKYDLITIVGEAENAHENLWYKTSSGGWIYCANIEKHSHEFSSHTGKCVCGKKDTYTDKSKVEEYFQLTKETTLRDMPFPGATDKGTYKKDHVFRINGYSFDGIAYWNPTWYRTTDNKWIPADNLKKHEHKYNGGLCEYSGCGYEFKITEEKLNSSGKAEIYETVGTGRVVRVGPYDVRAVKETLPEKYQIVKVTHKAKNAHKNLWYKTENGGWIYSGNIQKHEHHIKTGKCTSNGCGYVHGIKPVTITKTYFETTKANVPAYNKPYDDSGAAKTYSKSKTVVVADAEFDNYYRHTWYRTTDGYWVYEGNLDPHEHDFDAGICKTCKALEPIEVTNMSATVYVTKKDKVPVWKMPYSGSGKKTTLEKEGTTVVITGETNNKYNRKWYKTSDGYWIYSDNIKKQSKSSNTQSGQNKVNTYTLQVVDTDNKPVAKAKVSFGEVTTETNAKGSVEFNIPNGCVYLKITADKFETYENFSYEMKKEMHDKIILARTGKDELTKAILKYNKTETDIRLYEKTVNQAEHNSDLNKYVNFDIELATNVSNVKEYQLVQGGKVKYRSENGVFKTLAATGFEKDKAVYAKVIDTESKTRVNRKLLLNVVHKVSDVPDTMSLGKNISLSLPESAPFPFQGLKIELDCPVLPLDVTVNTDIIRIGINFKAYDKDKSPAENEKTWDYLKRLNKGKFKEFYKKNAMKDNNKLKPDDLSFNVKFGGYLEGGLKDNHFTGRLFIMVSAGVSKEFQFTAPVIPIPLVFELGIEGSAQADGTIKINKYAVIEDSSLELTIEGAITLYLGIGMAGFFSVGAYGQGTVTAEIPVLPKPGIDAVYASANFGVKAKLFGKDAFNVKVIQLGNFYLYKNSDTLSLMDSGPPVAMTYNDIVSELTDMERYRTMDRSYLEERSGWYDDTQEEALSLMSEGNEEITEDAESSEVENNVVLSSFDFEVMQSNTYTDIKPQVVSCDGVIMMVYADDNAQRSEHDRTMLVYSIYNEATEKWQEPKAIYDDGTADYNFSVNSNGENIYIVWQNANSLNNADWNISEIAKNTDLYVAKFDSVMRSFTNVERVTKDNDECEMMPRISGIGGETVITWFVNSADDVFGIEGTNDVCYAKKAEEEYAPEEDYYVDTSFVTDEEVDEETVPDTETVPDGFVAVEEPEEPVAEWVTEKATENQPQITSLAVGYIYEDGYIAFTIDEDRDLSTIDDQMIKLIDTNDNTLINYTDKAMNVEFTTVYGDPALTWFNQGYIYYSIDPEYAPVILYNGAAIPNNEYHIISSESGDMAVLYTIRQESKSEAYVILHDGDTYEWGLPVKVTQQDKYIQNFNGAYYDDMIVSVFNQTDVTQETLFEKNNLCCALIGERNDLVIRNVIFDDIDLEPLTTYPVIVEVTNNGTVRCESVRLLMTADGHTVTEEVRDILIRPGETVTLEASVTMPEEIKKQTYAVSVEQDTNIDADISNNRAEFTAGSAFFMIEAQRSVDDGRNLIYVTVTNKGYEASGGSLVLYDENYNIEKTLSENIDEIGYNETYNCTIEIPPEDFGDSMYKSFIIGIIPFAEQSNKEYNTISVFMKNATAIEDPVIEADAELTEAEDAEGISLMSEFKQRISGKVRNETENDIESCKVLITAYDERGIYIDTVISDASAAAGDEIEFYAEFDTDVTVARVKVTLIDAVTMEPLCDYRETELLSADVELTESDESDIYYDIVEGEGI